jgi:hypothetical protein
LSTKKKKRKKEKKSKPWSVYLSCQRNSHIIHCLLAPGAIVRLVCVRYAIKASASHCSSSTGTKYMGLLQSVRNTSPNGIDKLTRAMPLNPTSSCATQGIHQPQRKAKQPHVLPSAVTFLQTDPTPWCTHIDPTPWYTGM